MTTDKNIALITARNEKQLTQQQLAERTGFSRASIINWETGLRSPTISDLEKEFYRLEFITKNVLAEIPPEELELSVKAGELVGKLYNALEKQYAAVLSDGDTKKLTAEVRSWLNKLCVRLVFCFYAEDAGVFGKKKMFHDYLAGFNVQNVRKALIDLFAILDTKEEDRDPFDESPASAFPYVNGGLFSNCSNKEVPPLTEEIVDIILKDCCEQFNWAGISPVIFGSLFESTLNPETRRSGGMHYTSVENIHKVIDPLFLDELKQEYKQIVAVKTLKLKRQKLAAFQDKLASLKFLDPACGSGNFLTETYLSLREIENDLLREILKGGDEKGGMLLADIKVSISQFYGIEINDFAVSVAKTALWIAESQMMNVGESIIGATRNFLPLTTNANIVEGNALRLDWAQIVLPKKLNYIMGNPPFISNTGRVNKEESSAKAMLTDGQKEDRELLFGKSGGVLDYVACWFRKAASFMKGTSIKTSFVATDSICQGQQIKPLWQPFFEEGVVINFAYTFFKWESEASKGATVFVVIIGFSYVHDNKCKLFSKGGMQLVEHINAYLVPAHDIFLDKRKRPIVNSAPPMLMGGKPAEGGFLILSESEKKDLLQAEPQAKSFLRPYMMGKDFIDRKTRWCLWLVNADPSMLRKCPNILSRVENVKNFRLKSTKEATRKCAETPTLFQEIHECSTQYIAVPVISSGTRKYVPIDYLRQDVIPGNKLLYIENATLYHLGILTSNVHMAWMRATCSYYGPSYTYTNTMIYNNFPWPNPTPDQRAKIEQTAQAILDARAKYPDSSLADLYDDLTMPPELRKAHQENDKAVMQAYGFDWRSSEFTESDCVAELFKMYEKLVAEMECQK